MDKFPEAFQRFEKVADVSKIKSFQQLLSAFGFWAGRKWKETPLQVEALKVEAVRLGLLPPIPEEEFRRQKALVDELYRKVYYTYKRLLYNQSRLRELELRYSQTLDKRLLPRIEAARKRVDYWLAEWSKAFEQLKAERDKLLGMQRQIEEWKRKRAKR
ncbi:MAG: hypothetical protein ACUVTB_06795 [Candidatus Bathycorpusculaceae bacterium]